jgi:hypothetical protein
MITFNLNCASLCGLLKEFQDYTEIIPLEISYKHLEKIQLFLIHHTEIQKCPEINSPVHSLTSLNDWYYNFGINFEEDDLLDFLKSCHYLDCTILVEFLCAFIAIKLLSKTPEEVEKYILIDQTSS